MYYTETFRLDPRFSCDWNDWYIEHFSPEKVLWRFPSKNLVRHWQAPTEEYCE